MAWSADVTEGGKEIVYYFIHFCLFFEIIVFAYNAKKPLYSIGVGWLVFVAICSGIAIWELFTGQHLSIAYEEMNSFNDGGVIVDRIVASATFGNYNTFVTILCMASPWLFFIFIYEYSSFWVKSLSVLLILFSFVTILISGSRGGLISIIIMAMVYLLKTNNKKTKVIFVFFVLAAVVPIFLYFKEELLMVISTRQSIISEFDSGGKEGGRIGIWLTALKALMYTAGLGVGCGGIQEALILYRSTSDMINATHNMFVEFLAQYGIIWFGILMAFLWKICIKTGKILDNQIKLPLQIALIAMPVYMVIDSMYLIKPGLFVLFASIYVFANYNYFDKTKSIII